MVDPFTTFISRLVEFGFFKFLLPFILFMALIYALLKKSKALGESDLLNATIAIVTSFFILYFPVMSGVDLGPPLSRFFMQMSIFILIFVIGLVGSSVIYPDLTELLKEKMKSRSFALIFIAMGFVVFVTSGMLNVYIKGATGGQLSQEKKDVYTLTAALFIMVVFLLIASALAYRIRKGGEAV